ncbi:hypothetical protein [Lentzea terrae]|uniref:hypothetical protein n=1 Tax=Lentzea terrae TaxID=2200761 RepID=UPI000DD44B2A|nr:hypothetical protein [Lentzea terrae]
MNEQISRQLREAAEAHQPNRARILARVDRGLANATVRPTSGIARSWPRAALAGVTAAGVLVAAGIAFAGFVPTGPPAETSIPLAPPSTTSTPPSTTSSSPPPVAQSQSTPGTATPPSTTGNRLSDGPLSAKGSVDPNSHAFWTQDQLVLEVAQPLTKLIVQVHIAQTGGVQRSGQWQTAPGDDFTVTVQEIDGELVYQWELKPGRTVPAAQQIFAAQSNHTGGARDGKADRFGVMATAGGRDYAVWGGFTR